MFSPVQPDNQPASETDSQTGRLTDRLLVFPSQGSIGGALAWEAELSPLFFL